MERMAFLRIFWGLLFVVLDVRLNSIDLILPDFVGYILIASGLRLLAPRHRWFRSARVLAIIMAFVSTLSFIDLTGDSLSGLMVRRQMISALTGDLSALLPQRVESAGLLRFTISGSDVDANRTRNPERDEDKVLGEYSDGTVVLILRYPSPEEARAAMNAKIDAEYSYEAFIERAGTDESFRGKYTSGGGVQSGISEHTHAESGKRSIQQWWNRGWSFSDPQSWRNQGGWSSNILYIVEGYQTSAASYRSVFEGDRRSGIGITIDPLFPVSILGEIINTILIWCICSGLIALSLSSNNADLARITKQRLILYLILTVIGRFLPLTWFIAPESVSSLFESATILLIACAAAGFISVLLIMGLMRKAANSLPPASGHV